MSVSVVILTLNEQQDLPGCLAALAWCDDVHVVDSGSSDGTVAIAEAAGARCYYHPFRGFGDQRNWAIDHCQLRYDWVLFLDADEHATPTFVAALRQAVATAPAEVAGFYCCWKLILDGRWLRRSDGFRRWQLRLLRRGRVRFIDYGHGQKEGPVQGRLAYLREPYLHYAFSKGWTQWFERHNRYSDREAVERLASAIRWQDLLAPDASLRVKALKPLLSRLPGWPLLRFLWMYVLKGGFLEGRPGFVYCVNLAYYEFLIQIKMAEQQRLQRLTAPANQ